MHRNKVQLLLIIIILTTCVRDTSNKSNYLLSIKFEEKNKVSCQILKFENKQFRSIKTLSFDSFYNLTLTYFNFKWPNIWMLRNKQVYEYNLITDSVKTVIKLLDENIYDITNIIEREKFIYLSYNKYKNPYDLKTYDSYIKKISKLDNSHSIIINKTKTPLYELMDTDSNGNLVGQFIYDSFLLSSFTAAFRIKNNSISEFYFPKYNCIEIGFLTNNILYSIIEKKENCILYISNLLNNKQDSLVLKSYKCYQGTKFANSSAKKNFLLLDSNNFIHVAELGLSNNNKIHLKLCESDYLLKDFVEILK